MSRFTAEPIAIIGSGCRFPGGATSPSKLWDLLRQPRDVSRTIDRFNAAGFYNKDGHHHGASNVSDAYLLDDDPKEFDTQFFNIQPGEAESIDPQQRLLLETVYEGIESAGLTLEDLRGSSTAVYVGVMCDDYAGIVYHDSEAIPTYAATGISRAILSNRVSFVFDFKGPSMTIDTACSSSLVAIHQAVQVLRDGTCSLAVAAGANLIFSPNMFIAESNLNMLSATGKSQMWDAGANGYARGEGIAAVILKPLSKALADGDKIECIIRETGLNQDGHTPGITMPSAEAQTALIHDTYKRAGLDLHKPEDRCQYFEAHGTGTQAGDGVESRAIFKAFFQSDDDAAKFDNLYVGSIKTVIGHTEGTAGVAGVLKASLAVQNSTVPPNLLFGTLNPAIEPYYGKLQIATNHKPWPIIPSGAVRRASVNSFGFGGANAHAIVEAFEPSYHAEGFSPPKNQVSASASNPLPFVLSATSEKSLLKLASAYVDYLHQNSSVDVHALSWTLYHRRSTFTFRAAFAGQTVESLIGKIQQALDDKSSGNNSTAFVRASASAGDDRHLLGIFTGQGAQWATMGRELIRASRFAEETVDKLERALGELPEADQPSWSLKEQMLADKDKSRIAEGELSQPLCTALQVVVVDVLRNAGITFDRVVGHSSGEIGAAYAAGLLSATDAIKIAYYRGRYAHLARGPEGQRGGMIAAGTSQEDAEELVALPAFEGRVGLAAVNSDSSVTLSGDLDAVAEVKEVFEDESKFNRQLKVDTAYHSHHMIPCSGPYRDALKACNITILVPSDDNKTRWYSSVHNGKLVDISDAIAEEELKAEYWVKNMVQPVLFSQALQGALNEKDAKAPTMVIEVGPHPALKGPASTVIEDVLGSSSVPPYTGTIARGQNDVDALASTFGKLWSTFGRAGADLGAHDKLFVDHDPNMILELPAYPWNHDRTFWFESRESRAHRTREEPSHPLLGVKVHTAGESEHRWRNYITPNEVTWLPGHKIQGQTLMPAAAFLTMALEAGRIVVTHQNQGEDSLDHQIKLIELNDSAIHRALGFYDDRGVETLFSLSNVTTTAPTQIMNDDGEEEQVSYLTADFQCDACTSKESGGFILMASGKLKVTLGHASANELLPQPSDDPRMIDIDIDQFYSNLAALGYNYTELFKGVVALRRTSDRASGEIVSTWSDDEKNVEDEDEEPYFLHPSALDVAFQTIFGAVSHPGDGALWTLHIPTTIKRVVINPSACPAGSALHTSLAFSTTSYVSGTGGISGDIDLFAIGAEDEVKHALAQIEGLAVSPIAPATEKDDRQMFADTILSTANPDAAAVSLAKPHPRLTDSEQTDAETLERVSLFYLRKLLSVPTPEPVQAPEANDATDATRPAGPKESASLRKWAQGVVDLVEADLHPTAKKEWLSDLEQDISALSKTVLPGSSFFDDLERIKTLDNGGSAEDLLRQFYSTSMGAQLEHLAGLARQIALRFPQMRILELNGGVGEATGKIIAELNGAFTSYTVSDVSDEHFESLVQAYENLDARFHTTVLDVENKDVEDQASLYDLILVPHGLAPTKRTLRNIRYLLKPGGYLLPLQATNGESVRVGLTVAQLAAASDAELASTEQPFLNLDDWDNLLRTTGFSGVDTATPDTTNPFSVFVTQAVDSEINAVRSPLSSKTKIDHVLLVGGQRFGTAKVVRAVQKLLAPFCEDITVIKSLDLGHFDASMLASKPLVISLTELDGPFFKGLTGPRFENLQTVFDRSRQVVWVVRGVTGSNPYANMMKGLARTLITELLGLFVQILDLEGEEDNANLSAKVIVEEALRIHIAQAWKSSYIPSVLWSTERELTFASGKPFITRYLPNRNLDLGYNTVRRKVETTVSPAEQVVDVVPDEDGSLVLRRHRVSPRTSVDAAKAELVTIVVKHSIATSVKVGKIGYVYLCSGITEGGKRVLALSEQHQSVLTLPKGRLVPVPTEVTEEHERTLLLTTANILVAESILSSAQPSSSVVLHEPATLLAYFVTLEAKALGVNPVFTSTSEKKGQDHWTFIHPHATSRAVKAIIKDAGRVAVFVASGSSPTNTNITSLIEKQLPFGTSRYTLADFFGDQSAVSQGTSDAQLKGLLSKALDTAASHVGQVATLVSEDDGCEIALRDLPACHAQAAHSHGINTITWSEAPVSARVRSAMDEVVFSPNKTYFLIGMTGSLGLSTVMWMVEQGARYFALSSRNPKVEQAWLDAMAKRGVTVKLFALDITSRKALHSVHAEISATMPPIGGVANAALVIRDALFMEMDAEKMNQALGPKVDGSLLLDELFGDKNNNLDFFILYSSLVYVTGNTGQGAYCAGNGFLVTLAHGRRARGLTASVMNLAGISGIGFITRTDHGILNRLDLLGYGVISERDYLYLFAEAVLAGHPSSGRNPEVSGGLRFVDPAKDQGVPKWTVDPKFSHYLLDRTAGASSGDKGGDAGVSMKAALLEAKTEMEAFDIILENLLAMMHKKLRLPVEESVPSDVAIVELGVDSLIAVEIRQWFTDEFDVSIAVVKVLGGASVADLVEDAVQEMSPTLIPNVKSETEGTGENPEEAAKPEILVNPEAESSAGSSSETASQTDSSERFTPTVTPSSATSVVADEYFGDTTKDKKEVIEKADKDTNSESQQLVKTRPKFVRKVKMAIAATRFWFLRQFLGNDSCFNVVFSLRIGGRFDVRRFAKAVDKIGNRHEVFRTSFFMDEETGEPTQGVLPASRLRLEHQIINDEAEAARYTSSMINHSFDLEGGEVIRIAWLSMASAPTTDHFMIVACHHIAFDGFSTNLLLAELDLLYRDQRVPPVQRQFTDFAVMQRREVEEGRMVKETAYWKGVFPTVPDPIPLFPLAGVRPRAALMAYTHEEATTTLDKAFVAKIRQGVRAHRSTVFHFMLAAFETFLVRFLTPAGLSDDLVIGIADANRQDVKTLTTMGFLLNLLPLRFSQPGAKTPFSKRLTAARDVARAALENSRLPFDALLNAVDAPRSAAYSPLFQAFLDYKQYAVKTPPMLKASAEGERFDGATGYDLVLDVKDIAGQPDLIVTLRTQKSLYDKEHAEVLLQSFMHLVRAFANDFKTETTTASLFDSAEGAAAVKLGRGLNYEPEWPETISRRIDDMVAQYPDDIAVRDALGNSFTYAVMQQKVDAIGASLVSAGVTAGKRAGVFQEPSALWIASLLAIWRVGAVYLPLDSKRGLPALAAIVASAKPDAVLSSTTTAADVPGLSLASSTKVINVNTDLPESVAHLENRSTGSSVAALLFTSGSTGTPKGIELGHAGLANLVEGYSKTFELGRPVVLQHTTYSFDIALDQIITGLGLGGSLFVASAEQRQDSRLLAEAVAKNGVTYTKATPSEYLAWINYASETLSTAHEWTWAVIGGEHWNDTLRSAFQCLNLPKLQLQNCYGPTEFSITVAKEKIPIEKELTVVSTGKALPNASLYIVDDQLRAVPTGVLGEVVLGGAGAAKGYLDNDSLTKEKFVTDPYATPEYKSKGWTRAYRTGDSGYLTPEGKLVFASRVGGDNQVKIRGVRVELEDIEANIVASSKGAISMAVASVRGSGNSQVLVAFVEFAASFNADPAARAAFLPALLAKLPLPTYMTPNLLIEVPGGIPLNAHGKVDRRAVNALPLAVESAGARTREEADNELTPTESALKQIWLSILPEGVAEAVTITRDSDFFHVGGNSLMSILLQKHVRDALGVQIPLADLLEVSTLGGLSSLVDAKKASGAGKKSKESEVDWDAEVALPEDVLALAGSVAAPSTTSLQSSKTILLTGATGFTGSHILSALLSDPTISKVHTIAVRSAPESDAKRARLLAIVAAHPDRVVIHEGDLSEPFFGLSEDTFNSLASEADSIVHSAGSRSFWDGYAALKTVNVAGTRGVVQLAARARQTKANVSVHFISTGENEIAAFDALPQDARHAAGGYIASKWVSEGLLRNAAEKLGLQVVVHRMVTASADSADEEEKAALFAELEGIARNLEVLPAEDRWTGKWDLMRVDHLADVVAGSVLVPAQEKIQFQLLRASVSMNMDEVVEKLRAASPEEVSSWKTVSGHEWFGLAKAAGLTYQVTSMDVKLRGADGDVVGALRR